MAVRGWAGWVRSGMVGSEAVRSGQDRLGMAGVEGLGGARLDVARHGRLGEVLPVWAS